MTYWNTKEIKIVEENYHRLGATATQTLVPRHTREAVRRRIRFLPRIRVTKAQYQAMSYLRKAVEMQNKVFNRE